MKNKITVAVIIEYLWLGMAAFCLIVGIIQSLKVGFQFTWLFFLLSAVSVGMYFLRRNSRKKLENRQNKFMK